MLSRLDREIKIGRRRLKVDLFKVQTLINLDPIYVVPLIWDLWGLNCWVDIRKHDDGYDLRFAKPKPLPGYTGLSREQSGEELRYFFAISSLEDWDKMMAQFVAKAGSEWERVNLED